MSKTLKVFVTSLIVMGLFVVDNLLISQLFAQPIFAATVGTTQTYTGKLITNPDSKYTYKLDNMNLNIKTSNTAYFDKLLNQTVNVQVEYVTSTKFKIVSIKKAVASTDNYTAPSNPKSGNSTGYLKIAPEDSGYDYYLKSSNDDSGKVVLRVRVYKTQKSVWNNSVNQKVQVSYSYKTNTDGTNSFWNATLKNVD